MAQLLFQNDALKIAQRATSRRTDGDLPVTSNNRLPRHCSSRARERRTIARISEAPGCSLPALVCWGYSSALFRKTRETKLDFIAAAMPADLLRQ